MKKIISLLLIFVAFFALCACGGTAGDTVFDARADGILGTENMDGMLRAFLNISDDHPNGDMGERRPFSESEKRMSEHLENLMKEISSGDDGFEVDVYPYSVAGYGETQNVVARKSGTGEEPRKTVVICANYDALIMQSGSFLNNSNQTVSESVGALENGTGCATVLALMQYAVGRSFEFDLEFALFGDGSYGNTGAGRYVYDMPASRKDNILTVFALKRFGGDKLYMYNEEVETGWGNYLLSLSADKKLGIKSLPKQMPIINARAITRLPYAHWAMAGVHSPFMDEHIPVAAVFSGNYETLNLSDVESASSQIVSYTREDTYTRLRRDFSSYAVQMSAAANLVASALSDSNFVSVAVEGRANFRNYDWATKKLIVQLVVIGILIAGGVAIVVIAKKLENKYPYVPPKIKIKVAVFGPDYEDKNADVIIDVKNKNDNPNNPFKGY